MAPEGLFTAFLASLGVALTPGQRAWARVAFDGVDPCDLVGSERDAARVIFGDVEQVSKLARSVVVAVKGRGIGGTYISSLRALQLMLTHPIPTLAAGELAFAAVVAPAIKTARQARNFAFGAVQRSQAISRAVISETQNGFVLRRPDGKEVAFEVFAATKAGASLRGRTFVAVVMSEAAFFRDENFAINDAETFKAARPRLLPGGQIILESSPWAESGLLYELYRDNYGAPSTALVALAPTEVMRDDPDTIAMVTAERARDPMNAARELDAQFMSGAAGEFFDAVSLRAATKLEAKKRDLSWEYFAGGDFAFTKDASALVIVGRSGTALDVMVCKELRPSPGKPLVPSAVCAEFAKIMKAWGVSELWADNHYSESIREELGKYGVDLKEPPLGGPGKQATHTVARDVMRERRLRISEIHEALLEQLQAVVARPTSGGNLVISSPRTSQGHGDLASALVLAGWAAETQSTSQGGMGCYV